MPAGDIGVVMRSGMRESRAMYPPSDTYYYLSGNSCSSREIPLGSAALAVAIQYIYVLYIYPVLPNTVLNEVAIPRTADQMVAISRTMFSALHDFTYSTHFCVSFGVALLAGSDGAWQA